MGYGIKLTEKQWNELDNLRFRTPSADVFRNCLIILMSNSHDTIATIARYLGCGTDTVVRIRRLYRRGGIKALYPIKPPGRPSRATPEFLQQMTDAVRTNPLTLGYGFSTWSAGRLAQHLAKATGIRFSSEATRWSDCCIATVFRYIVPSIHSRADETKLPTKRPEKPLFA
jgi:transposase